MAASPPGFSMGGREVCKSVVGLYGLQATEKNKRPNRVAWQPRTGLLLELVCSWKEAVAATTRYSSSACKGACLISSDSPEMRVMNSDERLAIFNRVVARMTAHGRTFEADAEFRSAVDAWIEGRITMRELRVKYGDFVRGRRQSLLSDQPILNNTIEANSDVEVEQASP